MNKIFFICSIFSFLAHGYNTKEFIDNTGKKDYEYSTFNNKYYSSVLIKESLEFNVRYGPGSELRYAVPSSRVGGSIILTLRGLGQEGVSDFTPSSWGKPIGISSTEGERIHNFKNGASIRYYNTPEDEIEQKYLTLFVKNMIRIIDVTHSHSIDPDAASWFDPNKVAVFDILLPYLKKHELAIIRNLLFARHNYAFQTPFWRNFMNMYYPEKYNGLYSEWEVKQRFNWFEEWLLALVIEYEKKWGNAYDEFYKN